MTTPHPSTNTLGIPTVVLSTPAQQQNLQELLTQFEKLVTSQHIDYHPPQVTNKHKGVETVINHTTQELYPDINSLAGLFNISTTTNPSSSATTTLPSNPSEHTHIFPDYESDLSPSMLLKLVLKWKSLSIDNQPYHIPPRFRLTEEPIFMILGISTYLISYLLDPLLSMMLTTPYSKLPVWSWYLSCSQVLQHSTHWLHPTEPPQTSQASST